MDRHRVDVVSLIAGLAFVAVAVIGLTDRVVLSAADLRWLAPAALVACGVLLVASASGGRRRDAAAAGPEVPAPDGAGEPDTSRDGAER